MSILYRLLDWTRLLFGVMPKSGFGSARIFLVLHYTFMTLLAILFAWGSDWIRESMGWKFRMNQSVPDFVDRIWCGIMFVIIYCIIRVVLYLLEVLGIEDESDFPDIEEDWSGILDALERERLPIDDIPLFVVNGFTPQQEQSAFEEACSIEWKVVSPPLSQKSAVLRVFANDDAIFLSCTGIGVTNFQQGKVATSSPAPGSLSAPTAAPLGAGGTMQAGQIEQVVAQARTATGTSRAAAAVAPPQDTPAAPTTAPQPKGLGGFFGTIAPGGLKRAMETFTALNKSDAKGYGKKRLTPVSEMESEIGVRRMEFVCQLISQAREPYCPINGMLQAVPLSWAEETDYARKLAPALRDDLIAVHSRLQLQFPVVLAITELDAVTGMREFILRAERMQPGLRMSRAGTSFAAGADVSEANAEWAVDRSIQWFRGWVYSAFSYDLDSRDNQKLFHMLCEIDQRRSGLVTLLRDSLYKVVQPRPRLHGCYLCATGPASTEQGFVRGILDKMGQSQGDVAWTPQLRRNQARSQTIAFAFIATAIVLSVISIWLFMRLDGEA